MTYEVDQTVEVNIATKRGKPQDPAPEQWVPGTVVVADDDRVTVRLDNGMRVAVPPEKVRVPT